MRFLIKATLIVDAPHEDEADVLACLVASNLAEYREVTGVVVSLHEEALEEEPDLASQAQWN